MKTVGIFCGGASYEHEVSIVTGLQVAEAIDRARYRVVFVYVDTQNQAWQISPFSDRTDFDSKTRVPVDIVQRNARLTLRPRRFWHQATSLDVAYLAFHGGSGEAGSVQGLLEMYGAAYTSPTQESSVIAMNKQLTKEVLRTYDVPVLEGVRVDAEDYANDANLICKKVEQTLSFPVIIKPAHLGSSIGITIAKNIVQLEQYLNEAVRIDTEIVVEPYIEEFTEYNISVRLHNGAIEYSAIEEPLRDAELLSFADKYTKDGGKKNSGGGMELLSRKLPADISSELANKIRTLAAQTYTALRATGTVRIDFMFTDDTLYCTEVNPIPGSMSFYLWEATGESFQDQITNSIEEACTRQQQRIAIEPYHSDIITTFINQRKKGR